MLLSSLPGEGGWPFLAPKPLWWPKVLCPPSWDSDTGLGCGPLIHLASLVMILLTFGDIYALGTKASQQVYQERCYRCAQIPSARLWGGRGSVQPPGSGADAVLCMNVPGCEKGGKHCFKAHGSEALWGAGRLRFCCGIGGFKR